VLPVILVGLVAYVVVLVAASPRGPSWRVVQNLPVLPLAVFYLLGWTCRLLLLSGVDNPVTSTAPGWRRWGPCWCVSRLGPGRWATWDPVATVLAGEAAWSGLYASKTPVLAVLLALSLRLVMGGITRRNALGCSGWRPGQHGLRDGPVAQERADTAQNLGRVDSTYPLWAQPLLPSSDASTC
jgi:hypothetical protein